MAQYKTVAGPIGLVIEASDSYEAAVKQYAAVIDREAVGGWKLFTIQEIEVTKKPPKSGCLGGLISLLLIKIGLKQAPRAETVTFNMLVFVKED
jgi:hypothetical protein